MAATRRCADAPGIAAAVRLAAALAGLLPLLLGVPNALAQEAPDRFKTEIFLTPATELGDGADNYPRLDAQVLMLESYTGFFGVKDDNGQIPRSHWRSVQPSVETAFVAQLNKQFSIRSKVTLNSSSDEPKNNAFSDLGVNLDNLFAAYNADNYALYGGKMDIGFGDAWHVIDGLYTGYNENVEYRGAIGLGGRYTKNAAAYGTHSFGALLFKRDSTGMTRRFSLDDGFIRPDAPAAFSDEFKSFVFSYDFRALPGLDRVSGGVDFGQLDAEAKQGKRASIVSARLRYDAPLSNGWALGWYNEATYANAFLGLPVSSVNGVTSASLSRDRWQFTATAAARQFMGSEENQSRFGLQSDLDWAVSGAITYVTPVGFIVQAGITHQRDQSVRINQGVIRAAYQMAF